jgi:hypothetical protein
MFFKKTEPQLSVDFYQPFTQLGWQSSAGHTPLMLEDIFYTFAVGTHSQTKQ